MAEDDTTKPKAAGSSGDGNNAVDDEGHEEAAEILANLLQNQAVVPSTNADGTAAAAAAAAGGEDVSAGAARLTTTTGSGDNPEAVIQQMLQQLKLGGAVALPSDGGIDAERKHHAFWDTQPMLNSNGNSNNKGELDANSANPITNTSNTHIPIIPDKDQSELRQDPYNLPKGFEWSQIDITDSNQRMEVYDLLYQNYVEDDDCKFRFDYSPDFLTWALTPPGYTKSFHLGVRLTKSNRLMAFITAVPAKVRVYDIIKDMVEVNFLCVHKKLRSKRLAPVLIKEITRVVNFTGVFQAVYTAGVVLPGHVGSCRYYHRTLDAKKLVEVGFTRLPPRMTMARMQKNFKLPTTTSLTTLRPMTPRDVPGAHKLVTKYLEKFKLSVVFSEEEFAHWLLPRKGVVSSFVNVRVKKTMKHDESGKEEAVEEENEEEEEITDFCSYYHLHSSVLGVPAHSTLYAAYSFYNVATSVDLTELMRDCLILAKNEGHDVFNALNLMENERFLSDLKFGMGDGNLQYYVFNWLCPIMEHGDVALVLL